MGDVYPRLVVRPAPPMLKLNPYKAKLLDYPWILRMPRDWWRSIVRATESNSFIKLEVQAAGMAASNF